MTTETASLIIKVDSTGAKRASDDLDKLTKSSGGAERATGGLTTAYKAFGAVLATGAVAKAISGYIRLADQSANMTARLRLATKSQEEFNAAQRETFNIAQRTRGELGSVVDLYAKLTQSTGELGLTQAQVLQMTETITQSFQVSGASAQEAAGGLRQLGQAMAGGTLRAEEFNSIIESSPRIVQALADHFGVSFGKVRQLVNDGKISSEEFAQAMLSASQKIQSEFDQMPLTVSGAAQQVRNALLGMVGSADEASGATADLAAAISHLAKTLEEEEFRSGLAATVSLVASLGGAFASVADFAMKANEGVRRFAFGALYAMGAGAEGDLTGVRAGGRFAVNGAKMAVGKYSPEDPRVLMSDRNAMPESMHRASVLVSDQDAMPSSMFRSQRTGGNESAANAIKDRTKATKEAKQADEEWLWHEAYANDLRSDYSLAAILRAQDEEDAKERAAKSVADLIEQMEFEASLIGLSNVEREKAIALRQVEGVATAEQAERIGELVEQTHKATDQMSEFAKQAGRNMQDAFAQFLFDPFKDGVSGMLEGFAKALQQMAAQAVASKLFDSLGQWGNSNSGTSGWGRVASFVGSMFGGGKAAGGPLMAGQGYVVGDGGKPELFVPNQSGTLYPMGRGGGGGGNMQVVINNHGDSKVKTREESSRGPDGSALRRLIVDIVAADMASGGATAGAARGRFGLREAM